MTAPADDKAPFLGHALHRYQLFQLLRLLEAGGLEAPRLGERGPARAEAIRLRPSTSLGFPCAEVVELSQQPGLDGKARTLITANMTGLYGVGSPLPRSYAHQILLQDDEQPQQRDFLDLLHHRLLSVWYRAWCQNRYEQSFRSDGSDLLSRALLDLLGIAPETSAADLGTEPLRLLRYLSLLLLHTRPVAGLETLLAQELELPIRIEALPLRWVLLAQNQWLRLSAQSPRALGRDVVIGSRHLDRMGSLRLHIGPVSYKTLLGLWPDAPLHRRLYALSRFYLRQPLDLELHVQVPAAEVMRLRLGGDDSQRGALSRPQSLGAPQSDPVVFVISKTLASKPPDASKKEV